MTNRTVAKENIQRKEQGNNTLSLRSRRRKGSTRLFRSGIFLLSMVGKERLGFFRHLMVSGVVMCGILGELLE